MTANQHCDYPVEFVRKSVKHLTLRVTGSGSVRVTIPLKVPQQYAVEFLEKRRGWIEKHIRRINIDSNNSDRGYCDGQMIRVQDGQYLLSIRPGSPLVIAEQTEITVYCPDSKQATGLLDDYFASYAQRIIRDAFDNIWLSIGELFSPQKPTLAIKPATGRWGSYSRRTHRVMLNEKLIRYPKRALELIIIHELCHIRELNHGAGFYRLLEQLLPDWRARKKILKKQKALDFVPANR
ncbi:MAG: SprT family zinc-dependent metalloprotease [Negativicutes bacterium]|jgi:hypothetical protein